MDLHPTILAAFQDELEKNAAVFGAGLSAEVFSPHPGIDQATRLKSLNRYVTSKSKEHVTKAWKPAVAGGAIGALPGALMGRTAKGKLLGALLGGSLGALGGLGAHLADKSNVRDARKIDRIKNPKSRQEALKLMLAGKITRREANAALAEKMHEWARENRAERRHHELLSAVRHR